MGELEGLLAMARAEQFNSDAALAASGAERQIASLREQKGLLEEQARGLCRGAARGERYGELLTPGPLAKEGGPLAADFLLRRGK